MASSVTVRPPAVSGTFYPARKARLEEMVEGFLKGAIPARPASGPPKAVIAPHAGYIYSGPVAASAFATLESARGTVGRVVLLGPSHIAEFDGVATVSSNAFETALGRVPVDRELVDLACGRLSWVIPFDEAHAKEHCLEVELPFLQRALGSFSIAPFVTGRTAPEQVSELLDLLWGGPETLLVVSSDLSHYHRYKRAKEMDRAAADAIEALDPWAISVGQACGRTAIQGLLLSAKRRGLTGHVLDLGNSGDTAGPKDQVVGYGAFSFS